jgi:hypothetical protein
VIAPARPARKARKKAAKRAAAKRRKKRKRHRGRRKRRKRLRARSRPPSVPPAAARLAGSGQRRAVGNGPSARGVARNRWSLGTAERRYASCYQ